MSARQTPAARRPPPAARPQAARPGDRHALKLLQGRWPCITCMRLATSAHGVSSVPLAL